jgi:hypothetical protein
MIYKGEKYEPVVCYVSFWKLYGVILYSFKIFSRQIHICEMEKPYFKGGFIFLFMSVPADKDLPSEILLSLLEGTI